MEFVCSPCAKDNHAGLSGNSELSVGVSGDGCLSEEGIDRKTLALGLNGVIS